MSTAATRQALTFHHDGLFDIFLGLVLLDAWATLRGGTSSGGAIMILLPLLLVAKRAITAPRLPPASMNAPEAQPASKASGRLVVPAVPSRGPHHRGAVRRR